MLVGREASNRYDTPRRLECYLANMKGAPINITAMRKRTTTACAIAVVSSAFLAAAAIAGCATSARPLPIAKRVALTPPKDDIAALARAGKPIGEIVPVDLSISNGTDEPYLSDSSQVFAIDERGERILPVPPSEAIQEAGEAGNLKAGLIGAGKSAATGALIGAVIGAALGAAAGTLVGVPPVGAAFGAAIGGGLGAATAGTAGGMQGQAAAHMDAATQISALCLKSQEAHPNYSVNGYVFFPKAPTECEITLLSRKRTDAHCNHELRRVGASTTLTSNLPQRRSNTPE